MAPDTSSGGAQKRQRTRERLIAAALEVVAEKGFVAASLDEIAARAGLTKGAIYGNFAGKSDLMFAVAASQSLSLEPAPAPGAALAEQLAAAADALVALLPRAGGLQRLNAEFQIYALTDPDLRARSAAVYLARFDRLTERTQTAHGERLAMPARDLVMALQALTLGFIHQHQITPEAVTEQTIRSAFDALARGAVR
ncbi:MAG: TetR family transcriptional regulator [Phenylobacterium sp.]|nr:TetR family transcriptional regulator [Phenylobacterium sp.]